MIAQGYLEGPSRSHDDIPEVAIAAAARDPRRAGERLAADARRVASRSTGRRSTTTSTRLVSDAGSDARRSSCSRRSWPAEAACLEIGVGTGLLALPLHARGVPLVGLDLARPMMDKLDREVGRPRAGPARPGRRHPPAVRATTRSAAAYLALGAAPDPGLGDGRGGARARGAPGGVILGTSGGRLRGPTRGDPGASRRSRAASTGAGRARRWGGCRRARRRDGRPGRAAPRPARPIVGSRRGDGARFLDARRATRLLVDLAGARDVGVRARAEVRAWAEERFGALDHDAARHRASDRVARVRPHLT